MHRQPPHKAARTNGYLNRGESKKEKGATGKFYAILAINFYDPTPSSVPVHNTRHRRRGVYKHSQRGASPFDVCLLIQATTAAATPERSELKNESDYGIMFFKLFHASHTNILLMVLWVFDIKGFLVGRSALLQLNPGFLGPRVKMPFAGRVGLRVRAQSNRGGDKQI